MKIHDVVQGSENWLALRRSYFTASDLGKWVAGTTRPAEDAKAKRNAIFAKLGEMSLDEEPNIETWAMKRGKKLEPDARDAYEIKTGFKVEEIGLVSHDSEGFACSPDGLIRCTIDPKNFSHGLEIKCAIARTHLKWLFDGTLPDEHLMQVHASMAVTGLDRWDFFAWHPELPPLLLEIKRDEFTERVLAGLLQLTDDYMEAKCRLSAMWKKHQEEVAA